MDQHEIYNGVISEGTNDLFFVSDTLERHGVPWCVIGGMAINTYVDPVYTADCDLVVQSDKVAAVVEDLKAANWKVREYPFSINAQRRLKPGEPTAHRLMVQFTKPERYQSFPDRAEMREVFGRKLPVACLVDLVQGKLWALADPSRRESKAAKDWSDVLRLAESHHEIVEPLLDDEMRARSQTNRALHAAAIATEGVGGEEAVQRTARPEDYLPCDAPENGATHGEHL